MKGLEATEYEPKDKSKFVGIVLGLWLSGIFSASLFQTADFVANVIPILVRNGIAIVWPIAYFGLSSCRFIPKRLTMSTYVPMVGFIIFSLLSAGMSPVPYQSLAYVLITSLTIYIVLQFNSNLDENNYEHGMKLFSVIGVVLLVLYSLSNYVPGERLGFGRGLTNANAIGLLAMSVALVAMAIRTIPIRISVFGAAVTVLVLTGSRASAVATFTGISIVLYVRAKMARTRTKILIAGITVLLAAGGWSYKDMILSYLNEYLAIYDIHRGIKTGASGRILAWYETWQLFLDNPVLGVGFRAHEHLLKGASSAHNGYLAMLSEIGLPGFFCVIWMITTGVYRLWKRSWEPNLSYSHSILLGLCFSSLVLAIFERYLINIGNPTSLLFLLAVFKPKSTIARESSNSIETGFSTEIRKAW